MQTSKFLSTLLAACVFAAGLALSASAATASEKRTDAAASLPDKVKNSEGLVNWGKVHQVFSHPRCANCHVGGDHKPIWAGLGDGLQPRKHGMNVSGGASRMGAETGLACMTCHTEHNSTVPHGPPGSHGWALAPVQMEWFGKSSAAICAQIKDTKRNGGRTLEQVAHHVETEPLVLWSWRPGPGREAPPFSSAEVAGFIRTWARLGAPCPAP